MINNTTNISWSNYLREAINNLKEEGYHFNYIAEINKDKNLINKFPRVWRHPNNIKINFIVKIIFKWIS